MMSKAGSYHTKQDMPNQDAVLYDSDRRLTGLFLADGVSQCARGSAGARLSCEAMKNLLMKKGACFFSLEEPEIAEFAMSHVFHTLRGEAARAGEPVDDYGSTMACVLVDRRGGRMMTLNLGDGLIAGVRDGSLKILAMPDDASEGCCCTTTHGAARRTAVRFVDTRDLDEVFVCSDGAWRTLFDGGRMREEARQLLCHGSCAALAEYLRSADTFDDCSFISMDLKTNGGCGDERTRILK